MKILVTGAGGFIGEHAARYFLARGDDVCILVRRVQQTDVWRKLGAHCYVGDLLDSAFVNHACRQVDAVIHCAGKSGVWGDYMSYYLANVVATENLIAGCQLAGVSRLVYLSSPSIYFDGRDHLNIAENWLPKRFYDNYARTKYQAEHRVSRAHSDQLATVSLRPRMVLGIGDRVILPPIISRHRDGNLKRVGAGRNLVSVTSIDNLLQALELCLEVPDTVLGTVYNIANPQPVRLWDLVDQLMNCLKLPPVTGRVPVGLALGAAAGCELWYRYLRSSLEPPLSRMRVAVLSRSLTVNIDSARQHLGYEPQDDLSRTLETYASWWLSQHRH